jgi:hypothetical protein
MEPETIQNSTPADEPPSDGEDQLSRVGRYIGRSALPGDRDALIRSADILLAPDDLLADLRRLPEGAVYHTVREVWSALGREAPAHDLAGRG